MYEVFSYTDLKTENSLCLKDLEKEHSSRL